MGGYLWAVILFMVEKQSNDLIHLYSICLIKQLPAGVCGPVDGEEEVADGDHDRVPDRAARALRAAPLPLLLLLLLLTAGPHPAVHAQLGQVQDQPGDVRLGWVSLLIF